MPKDREGDAPSWFERRKAGKAAQRQRRVLTKAGTNPSPPLRVSLPDGHWIINISAWEETYDRALVILESGAKEQARPAFERLLKAAPENTPFAARAHHGLGLCETSRAPPTALWHFEQAAALDDSVPEYWFNIGNAAVYLDLPLLAIRAWTSALERGIGLEYASTIESTRASLTADIGAYLAKHPEWTWAQMAEEEEAFRRGCDAMLAGHLEAARGAFLESTRFGGQRISAWVNLGRVCAQLGRAQEAHAARLRVLQLNPNFAIKG